MATIFKPHNDEPTLGIDSLPSRRALLNQLRESLLVCEPPQVLGVHGDWGSGKTSFLQRLMYEITGECSGNPTAEEMAKSAASSEIAAWEKSAAVGVWFEAWRYQHDNFPVVALLNEIRARFSRPRKFWDKATKLVEVATTSMLFGLDAIIKHLAVSPEKIQKQGEKWEKEHMTNPLPTQDVRKLLEEAIEKLIESQGAEFLIIFIDDLDRCSSGSILSLLEGIKIYLNIKRCVFVLGINQHEIERAIARELSETEHDAETSAVRAQEYLEKLCGYIIRLPPLDQEAQRTLLEIYLKELVPLELRNAILGLVADPFPRPIPYPNQNPILDYDFLPPNPRRMKSFANTLLRLAQTEAPLEPANALRDARALCIAASLHTFHPELYGAFQRAPKDFWKALGDYCTATRAQLDEQVKPSAAVPPRILQSAKRPYVCLSAPSPGQGSDPRQTCGFESQFADASSLDTLFCQQLIAGSKLDPEEFLPFLSR